MNFHTGVEILLSVLYAVIFGVFGGILKSAISVVIQYFETISALPKSVILATESKQALKKSFKAWICVTRSNSKIKEFFSDFIFTLLYGISFSLLMYIAVDGVFRLYILVISVSLTYVSSKTLGCFLEKFFLLVLRGICQICLAVIATLIYPFRAVVKFSVKQYNLKRVQRLDKQHASC